jgi:hypothetical protein
MELLLMELDSLDRLLQLVLFGAAFFNDNDLFLNEAGVEVNRELLLPTSADDDNVVLLPLLVSNEAPDASAEEPAKIRSSAISTL